MAGALADVLEFVTEDSLTDSECVDVLRSCGRAETNDPALCEGTVWLLDHQVRRRARVATLFLRRRAPSCCWRGLTLGGDSAARARHLVRARASFGSAAARGWLAAL